MKVKIKKGDVFQFKLPNDKYAYGRAFDDTTFGFYKTITDNPDKIPEIDEYFFVIWLQSEVIEDGTYPIIGNKPFRTEEEGTPPLMGGVHELYGYAIYEDDDIRKATKEECQGLEPMAIFDIDSVIDRIMNIIGENKSES